MLFCITRYHTGAEECQKELVEVHTITREPSTEETVLCLADRTGRYTRLDLNSHNQFVEACRNALLERGNPPLDITGIWYRRSGALSADDVKRLGSEFGVAM